MTHTITEDVVESIQSAARKLTSHKRREFQAEMANKYCGGSARKAETIFGWNRKTVQLGLHELRTGLKCLDNFAARGRKKTEQLHPDIEERIREIAEPLAQADPKFQTDKAYTRVTAKRVRKELLADDSIPNANVPSRQTVGEILNRLGYVLRPVQKTRPEKKFPKQTTSSTTSRTRGDGRKPNRTH